jgi:general secretion pathway protein H
MPTSATGRTDAGFTLIELLAVIAIMAVLALPVALRWGGAVPLAQAEAAFVAAVEAARERALHARRAEVLTGRADGWELAGGAGAATAGVAWDWQPAGPLRLEPDRSGTPFVVALRAGGAMRVCRFAGEGALACADR